MLHSTFLCYVGQDKSLVSDLGLLGQVALPLVAVPEPLLNHLGALEALVTFPHNLGHGHSHWSYISLSQAQN